MISLTRQLGEVTIKLRDTGDAITRLAQDAHDREAALGDRVEKLASAIGDLIAAQRPPQR
jgi:ABC-type transporter Mla subunit MlaD